MRLLQRFKTSGISFCQVMFDRSHAQKDLFKLDDAMSDA